MLQKACCITDYIHRGAGGTCASSWARLIAKMYELNPLVCPRCGSEMKILAVITDTHEVKKILKHLVKTGKAPPGVDKSMFE